MKPEAVRMITADTQVPKDQFNALLAMLMYVAGYPCVKIQPELKMGDLKLRNLMDKAIWFYRNDLGFRWAYQRGAARITELKQTWT